MRRQLQEAQDLLDARPFRQPGRQQHEGGPIRNEIAADAGRAQGLPDRHLVGAGGADDHPARLVVSAPAVELGQKPGRNGRPEIPDHRGARMVDHRSILGHHRVEQLQAVTDPGQLE